MSSQRNYYCLESVVEILSIWFDYRLGNDPRFLQRIEAARQSLRLGRGVKIEDMDSASA